MSSEVSKMAIQESGEMYLENIWVLKQKTTLTNAKKYDIIQLITEKG